MNSPAAEVERIKNLIAEEHAKRINGEILCAVEMITLLFKPTVDVLGMLLHKARDDKSAYHINMIKEITEAFAKFPEFYYFDCSTNCINCKSVLDRYNPSQLERYNKIKKIILIDNTNTIPMLCNAMGQTGANIIYEGNYQINSLYDTMHSIYDSLIVTDEYSHITDIISNTITIYTTVSKVLDEEGDEAIAESMYYKVIDELIKIITAHARTILKKKIV